MISRFIYKLIHFTLTAKEKAFVAFWASGIGSYLTANGLTYHDLLHGGTLWSVVVAVVTQQLVYWISNSKA